VGWIAEESGQLPVKAIDLPRFQGFGTAVSLRVTGGPKLTVHLHLLSSPRMNELKCCFLAHPFGEVLN
jgi:hypothetical protein